MRNDSIYRDFDALPAEARRQVIDFIAFLKTRYADVKSTKKFDLSDNKFVGMWRDREDMTDSSIWVRSIRKNEWAE